MLLPSTKAAMTWTRYPGVNGPRFQTLPPPNIFLSAGREFAPASGSTSGRMTELNTPLPPGSGNPEPPAPNGHPPLARTMGLTALIVYGVGDMIGAGVYGTIGK